MNAHFRPDSVPLWEVFPLRRLAQKNPELFAQRLSAAQLHLSARAQSKPKPSYPDELPISAHAKEIEQLIQQHQVVIVGGETGSGKTTQLPKICLAAGYGVRGMIGHTQPRRLAARTVAKRIADELAVDLGQQVGFAVRFSDQWSDNTLIKVMTDGLLLNEIQRDRYLNRYQVLIIDEAHERSLNVDFLLGYLKWLLTKRADLKLIITSATIDLEQFSNHFNNAPTVQVSGRGFPVEIRYREPSSDETLAEQILSAVQDIQTAPVDPTRGRDLLVFQAGEREILDTSRALRQALGEHFEVLPLYARLSAQEQQRVFEPGRLRRIILTTNVAETSLTVPNIGYVIDPGQARINRYSYRSKLQRLAVEPISQASAAQRAGRCGRIGPGICYRLYSEDDFNARPEFTDAEITRTHLASVVLQMRAYRLGDIQRFGFIDPPSPAAVKDAERLLFELSAISDINNKARKGANLTAEGRAMAALPIDPRLARMLVAANRLGALSEMLVIVSGIAIQDPRERPLEKQQAADQAHAQFNDPRSDLLSWLRLWQWFEEQRQQLSRSALQRLLRKTFLAPARMREWRELHRQLLLACKHLGYKLNTQEADYALVHQSVLTGSLSLIGLLQEKGEYLGARNLKFRIFPGSSLVKNTPKWIVASEIAETSRVYARGVAGIQAAWIERHAKHLLKRQHSQPHWSLKRAEVMAYERVSLFGLALVEKRAVAYSKIDPELCRTLLASEGLVRGAISPQFDFLEHNRKLLARLSEREAKQRRRDLVVSEEVQAEFYLERLPAQVCSRISLENWLRKHPDAQQQLHMTEADLLARSERAPSVEDFPNALELGQLNLALKYRFAPGQRDDGVSLQVPLGVVHHLNQDRLDWLVPGLLANRCEAMLRGLPKQIRRQLAPIPDKLEALTRVLTRAHLFRSNKLSVALAEQVEQQFGVRIPADAWRLDALDPHLHINIQVRDKQDKLLDQDRSLAALRKRLARQMDDQLSDTKVRAAHEQHNLRQFPSTNVAAELLLDTQSGQVMVYPALQDAGQTVDLVLLESRALQASVHQRGLCRLALLNLKRPLRALRRQLDNETRLKMHFATLGDARLLQDELLCAAAWYCFFEDRTTVLNTADFEHRMTQYESNFIEIFQRVIEQTKEVLEVRFQLACALQEERSPAWRETVADVQLQLERLVPNDFLRRTSARLLAEMPRYLRGAQHRLEHLPGRVDKDRASILVINRWQQRFEQLLQVLPGQELEALKLSLEEYRLALFAQALGTKQKVSEQRLAKAFKPFEIRAGLA